MMEAAQSFPDKNEPSLPSQAAGLGKVPLSVLLGRKMIRSIGTLHELVAFSLITLSVTLLKFNRSKASQ